MRAAICTLIAAFALAFGYFVLPVGAQTTPAFTSRVISATINGAGGALTANNILGAGSCVSTISGTFSGTLGFQASGDNSHFTAVTSYPDPGVGTNGTQTTTVVGTWTSPVPSNQAFRVSFVSWSSGSALVTISCSTAPAVPL